jgi:hypothetical protein
LAVVSALSTEPGARGAAAIEFGYSAEPSGIFSPLNNLAMGWAFSTSRPIQFTHWGLFDVSPAGFHGTNRLSLWTASGSLLASAVITHSTPSAAPGAFRFVPVAGFALPPGEYVIALQGSTNFFDFSEYVVGGPGLLVTSTPPITYLGARYTDRRTNDSPWFPDLVAPANRWYFGPNFQFAVLPQFQAVQLWQDGTIALNVAGEIGSSYRLQATTEVTTSNWIDVASFALTLASTNIIDTTASNHAQRFYRVITP